MLRKAFLLLPPALPFAAEVKCGFSFSLESQMVPQSKDFGGFIFIIGIGVK